MINARSKRAKLLFFIVRYSNVWRLSRCSRRPNFCRNGRLHYLNAMFFLFHFFFRGIFQNHVVDSDYSCFTASSYGYHYCMPRHQEAQASSWVRKFPCRFSCLLIAFSPRSRPLFLRVTVQYLVFFEAVLFGCHSTLPPQFLWGSAAWHPKKRLRRRVSIIGTIFFFVLSRMCAFANELFRWKVVSLTSCFVHELFR